MECLQRQDAWAGDADLPGRPIIFLVDDAVPRPKDTVGSQGDTSASPLGLRCQGKIMRFAKAFVALATRISLEVRMRLLRKSLPDDVEVLLKVPPILRILVVLDCRPHTLQQPEIGLLIVGVAVHLLVKRLYLVVELHDLSLYSGKGTLYPLGLGNLLPSHLSFGSVTGLLRLSLLLSPVLHNGGCHSGCLCYCSIFFGGGLFFLVLKSRILVLFTKLRKKIVKLLLQALLAFQEILLLKGPPGQIKIIERLVLTEGVPLPVGLLIPVNAVQEVLDLTFVLQVGHMLLHTVFKRLVDPVGIHSA